MLGLLEEEVEAELEDFTGILQWVGEDRHLLVVRNLNFKKEYLFLSFKE